MSKVVQKVTYFWRKGLWTNPTVYAENSPLITEKAWTQQAVVNKASSLRAVTLNRNWYNVAERLILVLMAWWNASGSFYKVVGDRKASDCKNYQK